MFYGDDDAELSPSSADAYESPSEAKRRALKAKLEKHGFRPRADSQGTNLKDLKLSVLKNEMKGKEDKAKHASATKRDAVPGSSTKTREQEIRAATLTAQDKPDTDTMVQSAKQADKSEDDLRQEQELQGEDA